MDTQVGLTEDTQTLYVYSSAKLNMHTLSNVQVLRGYQGLLDGGLALCAAILTCTLAFRIHKGRYSMNKGCKSLVMLGLLVSGVVCTTEAYKKLTDVWLYKSITDPEVVLMRDVLKKVTEDE